MSSAMPGRYPVSPAIAEEIRRYVEALQEQAAMRAKGGSFGSLPPPIDPYTPAEQAAADAPVNIKQPAPRMVGGMPGMSAFSGSGPAQATMPPGFKIGGQVGSLGGQMMMPLPAQAPPLPPPIEVGEHPFRPIPEGAHGNIPQPQMRPPANIPMPPRPAMAQPSSIPMPPPRPGIPLPPPRPPEFGQSPGGGMGPPMMPRMPGGDFSTMLNIARGGPGMGGMGAPPQQPPQQPFGKDDLVSKMERPLGGILDSEWIGGGEPKDGGILNGGMPPWMMNMFGGGFGGFGGF